MKEHVVLPATQRDRVPYTDILRLTCGPDSVGEATVFISHAYMYPFQTVVEAVRAWEQRQPVGAPFFYYFDLFVVNQYGQTMGVRPEV